MSDGDAAQTQQDHAALVRDLANAMNLADRLGLNDVAAILREAKDTARRGVEGHGDPNLRRVLH